MNTFKQGRSALLILLMGVLVASNAMGTIYYGKKEALELAFGEEAQVEMQSLFLTEEQVAKIEQLARTKLESKLFTFYVGRHEGKLLGYAAIESHTVRTKPETLLIILTPTGELDQIHVLAFHEPPEYQPPERWFAQLYRRQLSELNLNYGIQGITGATLSSRAATSSARKVLAIYQIAIKEKAD
ncbi:FMN-binding protein [Nitrosococcus halophilus]|nr:FMN-binding protein [Nitrosococcus halophilus]